MRKKRFILLLLTGCTLCCTTHTIGAADKNRPNIIFIYASDFGKGLLSAYGQTHFSTPHIDALIRDGVSFNYAYGSAATNYARASLYTGYHDCRKKKWRITRGGNFLFEDTTYIAMTERVINGNSIMLAENDLYLPQVFKNAGYITAQVGMLGIGNVSTRQQMILYGWDYSYGYLDFLRSDGYYPPFLFENEQIEMIDGNTRSDCGKTMEPETEQSYKDRWNMEGKKTYSADLFLRKTIDILNKFKDTPFFLMYNTQLPKGPVSVPAIHPEVANNEGLTEVEKEYASMVKYLDDQVGTILAELRKLGLEEKTMIVFTSDNGHQIYYQQKDRIEKPYRNKKTGERFDNIFNKYYSDKAGDIFNGNAGMAGLKYSNLEGGIHIPLVFYWKGQLKNSVCDEVVSNYDFLPTMADLLGIKIQTKKDGISFLPALIKGRKLAKNRYIISGSDEGPAMVTNEGWKLRYYTREKKYELYNVRKDPEEKYDIILRFPEKAEELKKILIAECDGDIEKGVYY